MFNKSNTKGIKQFIKPRSKCGDDITDEYEYTGCEDMDWINSTSVDSVQWRTLMNTSINVRVR